MSKLYWEDFQIGHEFELGEYFLTQKELIEFGSQYDPQDFHMDPVKALDSPMGMLCATGIHTMGICQRLLVLGLFKNSAFVAGVKMGNLNLSKPVLPDETLRSNVTITEVRPLKDGQRGLISYEQRAYNPRDEQVLSVDSSIIMMRRDAA